MIFVLHCLAPYFLLWKLPSVYRIIFNVKNLVFMLLSKHYLQSIPKKKTTVHFEMCVKYKTVFHFLRRFESFFFREKKLYLDCSMDALSLSEKIPKIWQKSAVLKKNIYQTGSSLKYSRAVCPKGGNSWTDAVWIFEISLLVPELWGNNIRTDRQTDRERERERKYTHVTTGILN